MTDGILPPPLTSAEHVKRAHPSCHEHGFRMADRPSWRALHVAIVLAFLIIAASVFAYVVERPVRETPASAGSGAGL